MGSAAPLQFGCVALYPPVDRGVIDMQSPLAHHLLQISVAERIPQVPADTQQNDLGLEVTPFEWSGGIHEFGSSRFSEYRRVYPILPIFATQPYSLPQLTASHKSSIVLSSKKSGSPPTGVVGNGMVIRFPT